MPQIVGISEKAAALFESQKGKVLKKAISKYRPVATISKFEIAAHLPVVLVGECLPQTLRRCSRKNPKKPRRGFRGTRLCWQSLVCYTFVKERATRAGSTLPVPAIANQPFCPLRSKGISPSSFVLIFRHIWRSAEIFNPFCCISPKMLSCHKKPLTSHATP